MIKNVDFCSNLRIINIERWMKSELSFDYP